MAVQSKIWNYVYTNFGTLLSTTLSGETNNTLTASPSIISLSETPTSIFNGAWSLLLSDLSTVEDEGEGYYDYQIKTELQVGFEINTNDSSQTSYNNAVNDIETIITERLQTSSYNSTNTNNISIDSISQTSATFDKINNSESFWIARINFTINGFITLT